MKPARFIIALLIAHGAFAQPPAKAITINYAAKTGTTWPLYIAKEGGYFEKYGLTAKLVFAVHPAGVAMVIAEDAQMTNYPLEQAMLASSKDGSLVAIGSGFKKSSFAMMANKKFAGVRDLKGKRIGVSQVGDAPYNYSVGLLARAGLTPRDVKWVAVGTDSNGRAAALIGDRVDATMIPAPVWFKLEAQGFKMLANTSDYDDIYAPTVNLFKKSVIAANPKLPELMIEIQAEAIKRFYEDKAFAVKAYLVYDKQDVADVERVYDLYKNANAYERVPYIAALAEKYVIDHPPDEQSGAQMKSFDFRKVIDNGPVERLVKEGFFEKLFGAAIKAEEDRKVKLAFR